MHPRLAAGRIVRARRSADRGATPLALALLVTALGVAVFASSRIHQVLPVVAAPHLTTNASVTYLSGTKVPAPPQNVGLAPKVGKASLGKHVFVTSRSLSVSQSQGLFTFYLSTMQPEGWTLVSKGDPDAQGNWEQRWEFQGQGVLITMYTSPSPELALVLCPPARYC